MISIIYKVLAIALVVYNIYIILTEDNIYNYICYLKYIIYITYILYISCIAYLFNCACWFMQGRYYRMYI